MVALERCFSGNMDDDTSANLAWYGPKLEHGQRIYGIVTQNEGAFLVFYLEFRETEQLSC